MKKKRINILMFIICGIIMCPIIAKAADCSYKAGELKNGRFESWSSSASWSFNDEFIYIDKYKNVSYDNELCHISGNNPINTNTCYEYLHINAITTHYGNSWSCEFSNNKDDFANGGEILTLEKNLSNVGDDPNKPGSQEPLDIKSVTICSQDGVLKAFQIVGYLIYIIKIVVPLLLIILASIDLFKGVVNSGEKPNTDTLKTIVKRIIIAVIIFLIPSVLNFLITLIDGASELVHESEMSKCTNCLLDPFGKCKTK